MPICDPSQNTPPPAWARVLTDAEITPAIQQTAAKIAYDGSIPIGFESKQWVSGLPLLFRCECHTFTIINGQTISGRYHGCTVYRVTDPAQYPPPVSPPTPSPTPMQSKASGPDWGAVIASGLAASAVVGLFFLALKNAGRVARAA